jgi:ketosteroid isomerase-like protein
MIRRCLSGLAIVAIVAAATAVARADTVADEAAIRQRLEQWTAAFNAKDVRGSCDLFAHDLIYSIQDVANGTYGTMCGNLTKILGRSDIRLHYAVPAVREVIISGDIAAVRLTWTLTVERGGATDTTTEEGMDLFRRQPDGRWSIARYIAFTTRPNKLLP